MNNAQSSSLRFEAMPWALLLIWWGILELVPARPAGVGALGVAVILLGVNGLRLLAGGAVSRMSVTLGVVALVASMLQSLQSTFELDIATFPILLIACGAVILFWDLTGEAGAGERQSVP